MRLLELKEDKSYQPPSIDVGDEVLVGKFKNRRAEVKGFTTDDNNQPVLKTSKGDQHLFKPRIAKLMPTDVNEDSGNSLQTIIQSFVNSPIGQKYKQHDCKTVTRAFVRWAEQNKIPTQVVSLAPPSADFIAKNPQFQSKKGKPGQGNGHIMPIVNGSAIDFTVRQFGVKRPFENPLVTSTSINSLQSVYGKFGYFTDNPNWFPGGKSHWIGALNAIPPAIFNQNFGDEILEHTMAEGLDEDAVRAEAQAAYMQGQCMILAVAINQLNPKRYPIGYIWEYNADAGVPDMQLDDDEWENLNPQEQEEISKDISRHSIVHAYVRDRDTNEYIDARGRHRDIPNLWGRLGVTRFEEFPGTARELIDITVNGEWDEVGEQVNFKRGQPAFDSMAGPAGVKQAQDYSVKYLNIDPGPASQSTLKKPVWMNPGDPLPPSSPNGTWVILGPYKNVLYRFFASTEQRASAMKDQWCKENNIDPDSNRFCRLKYDGNVLLGQPIKKQGMAEARNSLFAFVKQQFPTWPDYVLKDFLYAQAKGIRDQAELDDFLKRNKQDFGNCKWTLTKLPITFDIFTPKTQRMLASREGGSSNPFQVPRDAERHALQSQMIQQKGVSAEPIIVAKLSNGYDLIEGWHRTIQHLKTFPEGYTGPAWVCTGATYKSESVEQGVAENFADGRVKGKSSPGRVKRSGASCDGSVSDLRSKAKNASGERAKMYHWCANMKNGRADESGMLEGLNALWKNILEAGVFKGYPCTKDCSGHAAGYKWSDDRDITDPNLCPYSNNSFWEGCLAHTDEQE